MYVETYETSQVKVHPYVLAVNNDNNNIIIIIMIIVIIMIIIRIITLFKEIKTC